ncbi:MAG: phosphomannomutase/phosphoglucomutase [Spirochaetia bacterium]|nr:phosphomannomutase/phosphoglucomutase [Spirochaetia bacterium]
MGAFKAYDIRGIFGEDLDEKLAYKVGYFLPKLLSTDRIVVGRDMRLSSDKMFEGLSQGLMDAGCTVVDIGLASTPMVYFATVHFPCGGSVQITASHNPAKYNGLKISAAGAIPVGGDSGLKDLEKMCNEDEIVVAKKKGTIEKVDAKAPYLEFLKQYLPDVSNLKLAFDCSNGMSSILVKDLYGADHIFLNDTLDGSFPAHAPNPLDPTTCRQLQDTVLKHGCDVGIIFDGDADRVMFVDEKGTYIQADYAMGLMGQKMVHMPGNKIAVCDIRTSRSTTDYLAKLGFEVKIWKVGHVNAKAMLRKTGAVFGGELAGHYYFHEFNNCDSGLFSSMMVLSVLADAKKQGKSFSQLMGEIVKYYSSGEVNFKIEHKDEVMEQLKENYASKAEKVLDFDGYRIEYPTWWFNIRKSNTEPYLRLVVEASTKKELDERVAELKQLIHD